MSKETITSNTSTPMGDLKNMAAGELQNIPTVYRLDGKNYLKWSQLVRTFLKGRGKLSHLLGTGPKSGDPRFDAWDEEDSMVMSWLWNSMSPEISDTCMFLSSAKEIWEAVQQTYSKVRDAAQIYEIKTKISNTKQGNRSVTEYSNLLKGLWQEMDHYQCIQMKCSEDTVILKRLIEKDRIYEFLAGLNVEFDAVRVQILGREELPSLNEAIAIVLAEEGRRGVMLEAKSVESSALVSKSAMQHPDEVNKKTDQSKQSSKDSLWCTHCKKPRHTRERCWKLHGKPQTMKRGQGQAYMTTTSNEESSTVADFNKEEIEKIRNLLGTLEKTPTQGTCSLVFSGTPSQPSSVLSQSSSVFNASEKISSDSWIIDSGATDHMTHSSHKFITYSPCPSNKKITIADGSITTVAGQGDVSK